jgi:hypothetical protein
MGTSEIHTLRNPQAEGDSDLQSVFNPLQTGRGYKGECVARQSEGV